MGYKHDNAFAVFKKHAPQWFRPEMDVIEMAPGNHKRSLVRAWLVEHGCRYHFADLNNRHPGRPGFVGMSGEFAVIHPGDGFDAAVCYQALHNIRKPWRWLPEVARIVRPGGIVVVNDSISGDLNRHPVDCWRVFADGMDALFDEAGLETVAFRQENVDGQEIARTHQLGHVLPVDSFAVGRKPFWRAQK